MFSWCPTSPLTHIFFSSPFPMGFPHRWGKEPDGDFHLRLSLCVNNACLWVSVPAPICCGKKSVWWWLICGYSRTSLGIISLIFFLASSVWFYPRSLSNPGFCSWPSRQCRAEFHQGYSDSILWTQVCHQCPPHLTLTNLLTFLLSWVPLLHQSNISY